MTTTPEENTADVTAARAALAKSKRAWRKTTTLTNAAGDVFTEARTVHVRNGFEDAFRALLREGK